VAQGGHSVDHIKLMLIMFFDGIRSERQLMRLVADRLSARWYCGYDLHESLPDHSTLTYIRKRYGLETFRRFFDVIVERCQAAGLVWGEELYIDSTKVVANAALDSLIPRFAVAARAHVDDLFAQDAEAAGPLPAYLDSGGEPPAPIGPELGSAEGAALADANEARHDWLAQSGRQDRERKDPRFLRTADRLVSTTDPDATYLRQRDGVRVGYQDH
jgi:hypothetical protein